MPAPVSIPFALSLSKHCPLVGSFNRNGSPWAKSRGSFFSC